MPNLRDLGGRPTRGGGRVRLGIVYRSAALNRLADADAAAFAGLGVRTVFDLRTAAEREADPDRVTEATAYVVADVVGPVSTGGHEVIMEVFREPTRAVELLGEGRGTAMWTNHFRHFVTSDAACAAYGRLFSGLAQEANRPALFHCTTGKDRTGWAAAALLALLGVPDGHVMEDYLASGPQLRALLARVFEDFSARGGDVDVLRDVMTVQPEYLDAGFDEVRRRFGSIERYFAGALGIDFETQLELVRSLVAA